MLNFIWNPTAGRGRSVQFRRTIEALPEMQGRPYHFWPTKAKGDGARIARELYDRGERDIIACGGDGTVHEVLNGLPSTEGVRFGILPCGSGNDYAASIGIPTDAAGAVQLILNGEARPTDYLTCSGVRCMNVLGTGIDVEILRYSYAAKHLKGSLNYFVSLLRALLHFRFYGLTLEYEGHSAHHDALIVCACNSSRIGGGIRICPGANVADGRLELVMVEGLKRRQIPLALLQLMGGKLLEKPFTRHEYVDRMRVTTDRPSVIQIDGELYEELPFDVRVVPAGLNVYRP